MFYQQACHKDNNPWRGVNKGARFEELEVTRIHVGKCLEKNDPKEEEHRIRPRPIKSGGGRHPGGAGSSRRRLWRLGRMEVEEEAAVAPHPVGPLYRG